MRRRRGFMLVLALLLLCLLLVAGLAFLERRVAQQDGARRAVLAARARALAEAGIEDALQKMGKDEDFPPPWSDRAEATDPLNQNYFSYQEQLLDSDDVTVLGSFEVRLDHRGMHQPLFFMRISSMGIVGPTDNPEATSRVEVVVDMSERERVSQNPPNPDLGRILEWRDASSL